jgi:hypothetical protein
VFRVPFENGSDSLILCKKAISVVIVCPFALEGFFLKSIRDIRFSKLDFQQ